MRPWFNLFLSLTVFAIALQERAGAEDLAITGPRFRGLGFPRASYDALGHAISSDGSTIVGRAGGDPAAGGFVNGGASFGEIDGWKYLYEGDANSVSADGTVIVGQANRESVIEATRWTEDQGVMFLGTELLPEIWST